MSELLVQIVSMGLELVMLKWQLMYVGLRCLEKKLIYI